MKIIVFLFIFTLIKSSLAICNDTLYTHELAIMQKLSNEAGRDAFLQKQASLPQDEFVTECKKVEKELKKLWGQFEHITPCDRIKNYVKMRIEFWEFFCSLDKDFRQSELVQDQFGCPIINDLKTRYIAKQL